MPDRNRTVPRLVALARLSALPEGRPRLVLGPDGRRLVCVRSGARVDVLDDRCPHEGHPLSMGLARDGVLTCPWHNWKFDLATGGCAFGGESARRYPSEVVADELFVDLWADDASERARVRADLAGALVLGSVDGLVRAGLRLAALHGDPEAGLDALSETYAARAPWGAGDALTALDAAARLRGVGILSDAEALAAAGDAACAEVAGRGTVELPQGVIPGELDGAPEFLSDLLEERRDVAVARVLGLDAACGLEVVVRTWLLPFASLKLWDRGAALPRLRAALARAGRLPAESGRALVASLTRSLGWAVAESDLPPWQATRQGLLDARTVRPGAAGVADEGALVACMLESERRAVGAVLDEARRGVAPAALLAAVARAAVESLARYDVAHSRREGAEVTAMDPARAVCFAAAALALADPRFGLAHAVLGAGLVGRMRRFRLRAPDAYAGTAPGALAEALASRDGLRACAAVESTPESDLPAALAALARFGALEARPGRSGGALACATAAALHEIARARADLSRPAAHAMARAFVLEPPPGLARLAANAARFVALGDPPDGVDQPGEP